MDMEFWEKHQNTSYEETNTMLCESHKKVIALIESLTDEELFEKKHFPWTGTTNIGSYCISVTSSHYDWAMKKQSSTSRLVNKTGVEYKHDEKP